MPNRALIVEYPESIPAISNQSTEAFESEARMAMAVKLYEIGRISSGQAALLAGIGRVEFLLTCRQMGVPSVEWDDNEIKAEFRTQNFRTIDISLLTNYL
jgi:predicted HTH domain antitoxin